ncbi:pyridoxal phosphate-dependent transferase [Blastocladiella britannica]|nr:pyridoxal phosphate-dependent transferase [Blastocladiella britannica]
MNFLDAALPPASLAAESKFARIRSSVVGRDLTYTTQLGAVRRMVYTDYFASGRSLDMIEDAVRAHVLPYYANTHTTTTESALHTGYLREWARSQVAAACNATPEVGARSPAGECVVIFDGAGSTAAIMHMVTTLRLMDVHYWQSRTPETKDDDSWRPVVFVSIAEHHSNLLPWRESCAKVIVVPMDPATNGREPDFAFLEAKLREHAAAPLKVAAFSAGSNLTGIPIDTRPVARLMHRYAGLCFFDYAGIGAYVDIDMEGGDDTDLASDDPLRGLAWMDGVFLSPHKLIGGPMTPGVLIARKTLFTQHGIPARPGGGSVNFVTGGVTDYHKHEIVEREEAGTPAIVESIRCGMVFALKSRVTPAAIAAREHVVAATVLKHLARNPQYVLIGDGSGSRVPVFCVQIRAAPEMMIRDPATLPHRGGAKMLHHNFVSTLLNDLFGVQTRGGCMCAGPYGQELLQFTPHEVDLFAGLISEDAKVRRATMAAMSSGADDTSNGHDDNHDDHDEGIGSTHELPGCGNGTCAHQPLPTDPTTSSTTPRFAVYKPGYLRFSFNYFVSDAEVDYVLCALDWIAAHGHKMLAYYTVDPKSDAWKVRSGTASRLLLRVFGRSGRPTGDVSMMAAVPSRSYGDANGLAFDEAARLIKPSHLAALAAAHADDARAELEAVMACGSGDVLHRAQWWMHPTDAFASLTMATPVSAAAPVGDEALAVGADDVMAKPTAAVVIPPPRRAAWTKRWQHRLVGQVHKILS